MSASDKYARHKLRNLQVTDINDFSVGPSAPSNPDTNDLWIDTNEFNLNITVGATAPSSPATGDMWVDTN